jgi:hypothetical protein
MRFLSLLVPASCLLLGLVALADDSTTKVKSPSEEVVRALNLDPRYKKCVMVDDLAVVGSAKVSDYAMLEAAFLVGQMLKGRDDIRHALARNKVRVAIMAASEFTTDIPEHSDLRPPEYWNKRARGLGPTPVRPAISGAEENLLQYRGDPYKGENILIHEFGHAIHEMGLRDVDKTFDGRLRAAYEQALRDGVWKDTYAATNRMEYWAEGVQSWFDCNQVKNIDHNGENTREKLQKYDPRLADLLAEVFKDNAWRYTFPDKRSEPAHLKGFDRSMSPRFVWPPEMVRAYDEYQARKKAEKK